MTTTSALLGWMDPSSSLPPAPPAPETFLPIARTEVESAGAQQNAQWSFIEILAGSELTNSTDNIRSAYLAAPSTGNVTEVQAKEHYHFRVDPFGRPFATELWRQQQSSPETPNAIRVQVERRNPSDRMTRAQWYCLRALALALEEIGPLTPDHSGGDLPDDPRFLTPYAFKTTIPVRLGENWGEVYSPSAEAVVQ